EVAEVDRVDHFEQRALAVEQSEDPIVLVGNVAEPDRELTAIDLEAMSERRQLLEQSRPLVEPAHAFHEQALRARSERFASAHGAELDLKFALTPRQQPVHGI